MDIEQLAVERPEALARIAVDPNVGIDDAKAREIVEAAGFDGETAARIEPVLKTLWTVYREEDATLVEVNPLVRTADGDIVALDGKVSLDENAFFRHPEHEALEDHTETDPLEMAAKEKDLNYVKLDGSVGIIGNGAGLVMSTLDVVAYAGEEFGGQKPANFLDIGGGASAEVMANGLHIILSDPQVKSVFVNVFGGITACDAVANGIVGALDCPRRRGGPPARRAPRRQQRGGGPAHPARAQPPPRDHRGDHGRRRPQGRRAGLAATDPRARRETTTPMAIFLTADSKVIVQGMTGSEGMKHTQRMLRSGTAIVGGVNPRKAGTTVEFEDGVSVPVFGTVAEAIEADRRRRQRDLRAGRLHQGRRHRGDRRRHPARGRHHRGRRRARHRGVLQLRQGARARRGSSARTARA